MSNPTQIMGAAQPPPPHVSPKKTWVTKLIFRIASFIFSIVLIGLTAYLGVSFIDGIWSLLFLLPPAAFAAIWNVAEIICILARRGHRGIHPAAILSIDLILWLAYVVLTVMYALFGFLSAYSYYYDSSYYSYSSRSGRASLAQAIVAFGALEVVCHFSLFVIGCVETNIRNHAPPRVVYYAAPPGMQPIHFQPNGAYPGQPVQLPANVYYQPPVNGSGYPPQQQHYSWAPAPAAGVSPQSSAAVPNKEGP